MDSILLEDELIEDSSDLLSNYNVNDPTIDLENYANNYTGLARIQRLGFIVDHCVQLKTEALKLSIACVKESFNVALYKQLHDSLAKTIDEENDRKMDLSNDDKQVAKSSSDAKCDRSNLSNADSSWVEKTAKKAAIILEKLEQDLKCSKSNSIKESIRRGYDELGDHHLNSGSLPNALKCYSRARDYCSSHMHVINSYLNIIRVSILLQNWGNVISYATKADGLTNLFDGINESSTTGGVPSHLTATSSIGVSSTAVPSSGTGSSGSVTGAAAGFAQAAAAAAAATAVTATVSVTASGGGTIERTSGSNLSATGGSNAIAIAIAMNGTSASSGSIGAAGMATASTASSSFKDANSVLAIITRLKCAIGVAQLAQKKYKTAAKFLMQAQFDFCELSDFVSCSNVALYGGLCALATFDRDELQKFIINGMQFKPFLELEPQLREAIFKFYESKYSVCLKLLDECRDNWLLDMFLGPHLDILYRKIRNRALIQYFSPYLSADLNKMAVAFNRTVDQLEEEIIQLILDGQIQARIDSHRKILFAKKVNPRNVIFQNILNNCVEYQKRTRLILLRTVMQRNQIYIKKQSSREMTDTHSTDANFTN